MTTPNPQPPPFDTGNGLLGETPAQLSAALMDTPAGQRMVLTVRTASTTLSVLLARDDVRDWAQLIKSVGDQMSGLIVAGPGALSGMPVNGNGQQVAR
jgi:hypothetical protein